MVTVVQQNADPRKQERFTAVDTLLTLTEQALSISPQTELVVWAEGSLPYEISRLPKERYPHQVQQVLGMAESHSLHLITETGAIAQSLPYYQEGHLTFPVSVNSSPTPTLYTRFPTALILIWIPVFLIKRPLLKKSHPPICWSN